MQNNKNKTNIIIPEGYRFECIRCGECCRRWDVCVDPETFEKLEGSGFIDKKKAQFPQSPVMWYDRERDLAFIDVIAGECVMLERGLCCIHSEMGYECKPHRCRTFPFIFTHTPSGVFTGMSHFCPAVLKGAGKPLQELTPFFERQVKNMNPNRRFGDNIALARGITVDWEGYLKLEGFIDGCIKKDSVRQGTFDVLAVLVSAFVRTASEGERKVCGDETWELLKKGAPPLFVMDEGYQSFQHRMAASVIAFMESGDPRAVPAKEKAVLKGGYMDSDTFGDEIKTPPVADCITPDTLFTADGIFAGFIGHLLWRKHLVLYDNILDGIMMIHLLPLVLAWYARVSANLKGKPAPDVEDFHPAIREVERNVCHGGGLLRLSALYAENMLRNAQMFEEMG